MVSQSLPVPDPKESASKADSTSPGGNEKVRWEVVAKTSGLTPATILAGRLQAEGIPVRAWQEGAGVALGLTVGILGTGHVAVPQEYAEQARQILDDVDDEWAEENDDMFAEDEEPDSEDFS